MNKLIEWNDESSLFFLGRGGEGGRGGGFRGEGEGRGRGRGEGRGRGRGRRGQRAKDDGVKAWVPVTKLGRLVNDGKIRSLEEIYLFSLPIKVSWSFFFVKKMSIDHELIFRKLT